MIRINYRLIILILGRDVTYFRVIVHVEDVKGVCVCVCHIHTETETLLTGSLWLCKVWSSLSLNPSLLRTLTHTVSFTHTHTLGSV